MLSGGRLCVPIALTGDPEVVLLDDPSGGLDPVSRRNLWLVILRTMSHRAQHGQGGVHDMHVGIMTQGQLRALGSKQYLKTKFDSWIRAGDSDCAAASRKVSART